MNVWVVIWLADVHVVEQIAILVVSRALEELLEQLFVLKHSDLQEL